MDHLNRHGLCVLQQAVIEVEDSHAVIVCEQFHHDGVVYLLSQLSTTVLS